MGRTFSTGGGSSRVSEYGPIAVVTEEYRRAVPAVAFPSVKLLLIRDGATIIDDGTNPIRAEVGDVVVLRSNTKASGTPDGRVTISTIYGDTEYMFQHWYWGMQPHVPSADVARAMARVHYAWGAKRVRLETSDADRLETLYDELHDTLDRGASAFYLAHGLISGVIDVLFPHLHIEGLPRAGSAGPRAVTPRTPGVGLGHPTVREADRLLRSDLARAWALADLADQVHISSRQLTRDFADDLGVSPMNHLASLRVREMVRLIADENLTVEAAAHQVGWTRNHATQEFQRHTGMKPSELRRALHARNPDMDAPDLDILSAPSD